jgi:large subunit ribosomal protein L29
VAKAAEIRDLTTAEIQTRLDETTEELFNLRFQNATGQLDNYRRLGVLRREIARLHTILRERQLQGDETEGRG